MSVSPGILVVALNTASAAALLWLLCRRSARLPLLCRLGFWAGASGLLLHALTLAANGWITEVGPEWLLSAGFWLLALGWWFAPAGEAIDAAMDRPPVAANANAREALDFTDYTRSKREGHGA